MSKEAWVRQEIKNMVAELADMQPKMQASEIRQRVEQVYADTDYHVPKPDWFRKEVSKLRRHHNRTDEPWSIGVTFHEVPPDRIKTVVAVWKWALLKGLRFTIRQAKWVALLDDVVEKDRGQVDAEGLFDWATRYAARQKAKEVAQKKEITEDKSFDTADLDAKLAFSTVGYQAMVDTGLITEPTIDRDVGEQVAMDPKWVIRSARIAKQRRRRGGEEIDKDLNERFLNLQKSIPADKLVKTHEVIDIWLLAIVGSAGWRNLPDRRQNEVIVELTSEIVSWFNPEPSIFPDLVIPGSSGDPVFTPSQELLAEVGYEIQGWRSTVHDND